MNILHLEDNRQDAELTHARLRDAWPDCRIDMVDDRRTFLQELAKPHDVIISDFTMAAFDGIEALHLVREREPDIPFIFFSGTIGEERALQALRAGATDYLIKDRPQRLIPAIQRALREVRVFRERRAASEQMLRVQRLENLGMLAAGIAHDFNNVLAPMLMGVSLLRGQTTDSRHRRILGSIESSAQRGAALIRQILGFANGVTGEKQIIQPRHVIREVLEMMEQTFPKSVRVLDEVGPELWPIRANPTQLHQVLLNLCVNARDAMPRGGTVTLRVDNFTMDEAGAAAIPDGRAGAFLRIEVEDTGSGIPVEILERIWEPFFTTKEAGRGTGLGLSTVRSIVMDHGGSAWVDTRLGRGTVFHVLLPAEPPEAIGQASAVSAHAPRGSGELVLVVDDDTSLRDITAATLSNHGYHVLAAANGSEAVALLAPRLLEVRVVIADLDMPQLDGGTLARVVESLNPAIKVLLVSASSNEEDRRRDSNMAFLAKPFSAERLLQAVRNILHVSAVAAG